MSNEMIHNLGKRFHARYAKTFAELNSKIIKSLDEGGYDVPSITLDENGFAESTTGVLPEITALSSEKGVARVVTKTTKCKPMLTRYVVRIPWDLIEMTHNNVEFFNEYFDKVVQKAIDNYQARYGSFATVRYGETFMDYVQKGEVFIYDGSGDHLDLYFTGKWASNELVIKE